MNGLMRRSKRHLFDHLSARQAVRAAGETSALAVLRLKISSDFVGACTHLVCLRKHRLQAPDRKGSTSEYSNDPRHGTPCVCVTAAFAAGLTRSRALAKTAIGCDQGNKELPPELLSLPDKRDAKYSPIFVRLFKEEAELEVWKQDTTGRFQILKIYPICRWSGDLGPKLQEATVRLQRGSIQLRRVDESQLQLLSCDQRRATPTVRQSEQPRRQLAHDPRRLLVERLLCHDRRTISEIYSLARDSSSAAGRHSSPAYPFRLTPANLARHRNNPSLAFLENAQDRHDHFETSNT